MGANPGICIGRGADGKEWVHVLYHRRPLLGGDVGPDCHPFAYVYRGKPTSSTDPAAGWGPESIFTDEFLAQEFVVAGEGGVGLMPLVDRRGRIHAIGRRRDGADSVSVCHLSGMPPGPRGSWKTERWVLDTMPLAEPVAPGHEPPYASPLQAACSGPRGAEVLDVVWNRNVRGRDVIWREIWFARLDLERDVWSSPVRIAGDADTPAFGARIARSEDGTVHAVYHIVAQDTGLMGLAYRRTNGDPCDAASWSTLEILTDPDRSLLGPVFVADCDTLWLGYTTERADQPPSHRWQAWFRKGYVATPFAAK